MKNSKELDNGIERKNLVLRDIKTTGTYLKIFGHQKERKDKRKLTKFIKKVNFKLHFICNGFKDVNYFYKNMHRIGL